MRGKQFKINALCTWCVSGREIRHSDPLAWTTTIQSTPSTVEDPHITDTNAAYSSIIERQSTPQRPELYCELRLNDQQSNADYINQSSHEQNPPSREAAYSEITDLQ